MATYYLGNDHLWRVVLTDDHGAPATGGLVTLVVRKGGGELLNEAVPESGTPGTYELEVDGGLAVAHGDRLEFETVAAHVGRDGRWVERVVASDRPPG